MKTPPDTENLRPMFTPENQHALISEIQDSGLLTCYTDKTGLPVSLYFNGTALEGGFADCLSQLPAPWQSAMDQLMDENFINVNLDAIRQGRLEEAVEVVVGQENTGLFLVSRFPLSHGSETGLLVTIRDISGISESRLKLSGSNVLFDLVADNMSDVFCVVGTSGKVSFLSPSICELTGYTVEELLSRPLTGIIPPDSIEVVTRIWEEYQPLFESGKISKAEIRPLCFEVKFIRKDKSVRWAEVSSSPFIDSDNNIQGVHGMIRDITERKTRQEAMRTSLQHEIELSQVKSRYISTVSHEFRTPLSIIYSNLQLLEKYRFELDEETIHDAFELSRMAVKSLLRVLDKVTIIDASGKGKLEFKPSICNVHELCQEVVDEMNEMELVPNRIDLAVANDIGNASIDENLFRHIFINLLQNALNYSDKKQNVSFSVYPGEKGFINFKVADKGIGIPPQDMQFIYDPFYRASNSRHAKGSGLGLAVVKECLQLHNGEIFVESDPLKGSIFTVVIPVGNTE